MVCYSLDGGVIITTHCYAWQYKVFGLTKNHCCKFEREGLYKKSPEVKCEITNQNKALTSHNTNT